jgi:HD-GYP domain-containing protein (c-di-GMP phosphodiesterase class II)
VSVFTEVAERFQGLDNGPAGRPAPTHTDLLLAASKAMDLLEGKPLRSGMKVAVLAGSIAKMMGLPPREVGTIVYASLLHDIGLIRMIADIVPHLPPGVSEKMLFQAHPLFNARVIGTPHERPLSGDLEHMLSQHPLAARDFVCKMTLSEDVAELIAAHHELYDGTGYPFGLSGEQIPIGARIMAFADVVEGVLGRPAQEVSGFSTRRQSLDNFLEIKAPGKFDPQVIEVFTGMIEAYDDLLRMISTLEVENMLRCLLPQRSLPMDGHTLLSIVSALGELPDMMMPLYKGNRSQNMAQLAMRLAESLGIHREQCGELAMAAMLMDIGHLATPMSILTKPGLLTVEEREVIQSHPVMTQEVLKAVPGFENIQLWASEHHERMNGKGYPGQKKGFEISVGGRILALTDVFDALTSYRPHRAHAHEPLDALPVIGQGRMTLYDNQLVTLLRKVVLNAELPVR